MEKEIRDGGRPLPGPAGFSLVSIPPCRVAAARGFGSQPELIAWSALLAWMVRRSLPVGRGRFFGFNDPEPEEGKAVYGYEQWLALERPDERAAEAGTEVGEGIEFKDFSGGLYAVRTHRGNPSGLPASWAAFAQAMEGSGRRIAERQCLEGLLTAGLLAGQGEPDWDGFAFDLYIPLED